MSHTQKVKVTGLLILTVISIGAFAFTPLSSFWTRSSGSTAQAASSLPFHQYADGPYTVKGNTIVGTDGKTYLFHGVGRDGLEFLCLPSEVPYNDAAHLGLMGPGTGGNYWYGNTVRLPLSEAFWLHGFAGKGCTPAQYQGLVLQMVNTLTTLHLNVILDLQWSDAAGQSQGGGATWDMPDTDSVTFWSQVATAYKSYTNVLFELFNEPHPQGPEIANPWACWQAGCAVTNETEFETFDNQKHTYSYQAVSMQALVNAVRGAGANNLVLVAGLNWGYDLSQLGTYPITGTNVVYDTHPYTYAGKNTTAEWDTAFGYLTPKKPVMSAEFGEYDGQSGFESMAVNYFDQHMMGWTAWAWYSTGGNTAQETGYPQLVSDYNGTPLANMGTYIYHQLLNYAGTTSGGTPPPPPPPSPTPTLSPVSGPVSKLWYFAEGRAGGGFKEFLTLGNPNPTDCGVNITYLTHTDSGVDGTKTVAVTVKASSRATEWVDGDVGTSTYGPGVSVAATVTVNSTATPGCNGIVAERPMYFNALGTNSGSDVLGVTSPGTTFYFADLATGVQAGGGSYSSFLPILNPGSTAATVTATYYANGLPAGVQTMTVKAGSRATIWPSQASPKLPARVSVVLTSTVPVVSERPTYFSGITGGNAGVVSGGADVIGVQQLSSDWLFAEGYTGGRFQENFVIANLDPVKKAATVTITLEYDTGTTKTFTVTVGALSQLVWNVNANSTGATTSQSVSAEITSSGAQIAVEREMYFGYTHKGDGRVTQASGGTDVLGLVKAAMSNSYSFAEGYTNLGYDEWLTVQNPNTSTETVNVTVSNAVGTVYTFAITVAAHSRFTVDMVAIVQQHMIHPTDGYKGFEISMAVQSSSAFVVERPMYWNASNTQGGSDVIGY